MISCEQYDYIELVCLFKYPVKLELSDGSVLQGKAVDTKRSAEGQECIELEWHGKRQLVELAQLEKLQVPVENPHLQEVRFHHGLCGIIQVRISLHGRCQFLLGSRVKPKHIAKKAGYESYEAQAYAHLRKHADTNP